MAGPNSCGRCEYPFLKDINPVELLYSHPVINLQPAFFGTTHFRTSQISPWFVVCGAWVFRKSGTVACHQPSTRTLGTAPHSRTICPPYHGNNCKHVSLAEGGDFVFFFTFLCPPIFFFFFILPTHFLVTLSGTFTHLRRGAFLLEIFARFLCVFLCCCCCLYIFYIILWVCLPLLLHSLLLVRSYFLCWSAFLHAWQTSQKKKKKKGKKKRG